MVKPLGSRHFKTPPRLALAADPAVGKLSTRIAEACRAALAQIRPAPWRVTCERILEDVPAPAEGESKLLRLESELGPLACRMTLDRQSISAILEAAMGGTGAEPAFDFNDRPLSKLELAILRLARSTLSREIASALSEQFGRSFGLFEDSEEPDISRNPSDLAQLQFTINVFSYSGEIRLCFERRELERQISADGVGEREAEDSAGRARLQREVGKSEVTLTVSLGHEVLPLEVLVGLRAGTLVPLSSRVTGPVIVWSGGVAAHEARLVRNGERLAVTICSPAS